MSIIIAQGMASNSIKKSKEYIDSKIVESTMGTYKFINTLSSSDTLPIEGDIGDYYIFIDSGTIDDLVFKSGDKYCKSENGWKLIPESVVVNKNYNIQSLNGVEFKQELNENGDYDIYIEYDETVINPKITAEEVDDGVEIYIEG